jgi:homoaconitase/3-isopropylmalate dehydratase large subunit
VEKIAAKAAGLPSVRAGDLITAKVDLAFAHDSSGPRRWRPMLERLGVATSVLPPIASRLPIKSGEAGGRRGAGG